MSLKDNLLQIFTWWSGQTIGTRLHTWRFGERVGEDQYGNVYYRSANDAKRWVIYNGLVDASRVPQGWYGWLNRTFDEPPVDTGYVAREWEKPHLPNMTGTPHAYRPQGSLAMPGPRHTSQGDYEAWSPE
jgi:NADH:ubiquinone oxidoreductase subunit